MKYCTSLCTFAINCSRLICSLNLLCHNYKWHYVRARLASTK